MDPLKMFFKILFPQNELCYESMVKNKKIKIPRIGTVSRYTSDLWKESHQLDYVTGSFNVGSSINERLDVGETAKLDDIFTTPEKKRKEPSGGASSMPLTNWKAGKRQKTTNLKGK